MIIVYQSCADSDAKLNSNLPKFNLSALVLYGGSFELVDKDNVSEIIDDVFKISNSSINIESTNIAVLDIYKNNSHFLWYFSNINNGKTYRIYSNKEFNNYNMEEKTSSELKLELTELKSI